MNPHHRHWLLIAGALGGYLLLMFTNPIRASLLDGLRCVRRYRQIWGVLALFGLCYALFQIALRVFYYFALPEGERPGFAWNLTWTFPKAPERLAEAHTLHDWWLAAHADPRVLLVKESLLEAVESLAGVFNNLVTTFPFSAIAAVLLLRNYDDHHTTLRRALRKRFGRFGIAVHIGILICALAAIIKPVLFGPSLLWLNHVAPGLLILRWSLIVTWLSFLFEYLFGVCVQIYLILLVYAWVRGLTWTRAHLLDVAIRRFSFVVKWASLVMLVSTLLIDLPRIAAMLCRFDDLRFIGNVFGYIDNVARPLLALFLIAFATMQITLTFHSESFRKAWRDHFAFLHRNKWQFMWFLLIAGLHFFLASFLNKSIARGFGDETATALLWSLVYPLLAAALAAWMLAAWVCLFKRCEAGEARQREIRF